MSEHEWDIFIDLQRKSTFHKTLACHHVLSGEQELARIDAETALHLERQSLEVGKPRWRDFEEHVATALAVAAA